MSAKRSLSQNFLSSQRVARRIVAASNITSADTVLEIGPGRGILTRELLVTGARVCAVEKDEALASGLQETFSQDAQANNLVVIPDDIFNIDAHDSVRAFLGVSFKIVANIPYNITGKLIRFLLSHTPQPSHMSLMVQKEVAERIVARDGKESILSVSVKAFAEAHYAFSVPRKHFLPKPRVDSAVVIFTNINRTLFHDMSERAFFETVKKGFSQKRKFVKSNINASDEIMRLCNISPRARAETLSLHNWVCLTKHTQLK